MGIAETLGLRPKPVRKPIDFGAAAISGDARQAWLSEDRSGLEEIFQQHQGRILHKWLHYLPIYDRYFARYRGQPFTMLEIGVSQGGSLEMWRKYFGNAASITGLDINPNSADCVDAPNQVRIGSQADPAFLRSVVAETGAPDIVLDDGSHVGSHQSTSFRTLFPMLKDGGLYVIEDLHTAYWKDFEGGYGRKGSAIETAKTLIDDMHQWYHDQAIRLTADVAAVHFHDSIVVIEKSAAVSPQHMHVGRNAPSDGSPPVNAEYFPPRSDAN